MNFSEILSFQLVKLGDYSLHIYQLIALIFIFILARYGSTLLIKASQKWMKGDNIDSGRRYAFEKFVKYTFYLVATLLAFQSLGVNMSVILAGSAALMVGIGFGIQQTANDFISGIIILIDGSIGKEDILTVGEEIGIIKSIGLRTSEMKTLDNKIIIIPNSKLVNDNVINWSHNDDIVRFNVPVGVSYSADVDEVEKLLLDVAEKNENVLSKPRPFVRFVDFGESSLDFKLYCFHHDIANFEDIKSKIRFSINRTFKKNNIEIPFPQRDLWFKNQPIFPRENNIHQLAK